MANAVVNLLLAALVRAYRTAVYAFVGSAGVGNIEPVSDLAGLRSTATVWAFALTFAAASGLVAFLVATAEGLADRPLAGPGNSQPRNVNGS